MLEGGKYLAKYQYLKQGNFVSTAVTAEFQFCECFGRPVLMLWQLTASGLPFFDFTTSVLPFQVPDHGGAGKMMFAVVRAWQLTLDLYPISCYVQDVQDRQLL